MSFANKSPAETRKDLLYVDNSNSGVDSTVRSVKSGSGSDSSGSVSDRSLKVKSATDNTAALDVQNSGGTTKFLVDTTNSYVKANGVFVNTQYAYFGVEAGQMAGLALGTHYAIPFQNTVISGGQNDVDFGTGTDPATTFTTADTDTQYASQIVPMMWLVPDDISIDSVTAIEGADAATGDTTRLHLLSYTFTSGSTSCLTSGTLLAHNSDVTNAGNEQAYKTAFTIDSAAVAADKVILAFIRADSVNSDYSVNITVKYHITG